MQTIWKFKITSAKMSLEMPDGSTVLTVQAQDNYPNMWCLVDPNAPKVTRKFEVMITGEEFDSQCLEYVGTFQTDKGSFVGHVFEVIE